MDRPRSGALVLQLHPVEVPAPGGVVGRHEVEPAGAGCASPTGTGVMARPGRMTAATTRSCSASSGGSFRSISTHAPQAPGAPRLPLAQAGAVRQQAGDAERSRAVGRLPQEPDDAGAVDADRVEQRTGRGGVVGRRRSSARRPQLSSSGTGSFTRPQTRTRTRTRRRRSAGRSHRPGGPRSRPQRRPPPPQPPARAVAAHLRRAEPSSPCRPPPIPSNQSLPAAAPR